MQPNWIADRMSKIEASGIRKIFELGRKLANPINLSIGQPHFDVPEPIRAAAHDAIDSRKNGYTVTQGVPELLDELRTWVRRTYNDPERDVLLTSGTSGGLVLALCATVNPGDEVILFDPYFVSYPHLVTLAGGTSVKIDTYPDFQIDLAKLEQAITPRTKAILFSSPSNPTGVTLKTDVLKGLVEIARKHGVLLMSDEIYRVFHYDHAPESAGQFDPNVLVLDGFGKAYAMTGWRLGFAHGPKALIQEMAKLQQFTFVCPPSMVQYAGVAAWRFDPAPFVNDYRQKRDRIYDALKNHYEIAKPGGAFYLYPKVPAKFGNCGDFAARCIDENLLIVPGNAFSARDSHFAASDGSASRRATKRSTAALRCC